MVDGGVLKAKDFSYKMLLGFDNLVVPTQYTEESTNPRTQILNSLTQFDYKSPLKSLSLTDYEYCLKKFCTGDGTITINQFKEACDSLTETYDKYQKKFNPKKDHPLVFRHTGISVPGNAKVTYEKWL